MRNVDPTMEALAHPGALLERETYAQRWLVSLALLVLPFAYSIRDAKVVALEEGARVVMHYRDWGALVCALALATLGLKSLPDRGSLRDDRERAIWLHLTFGAAVWHGLRAFGWVGPLMV